MKKRMIILPLSVFALISCSKEVDNDIRNKYTTEKKCITDNPINEIKQNIQANVTPDIICEKVNADNQTYWLGPAYPHSHYGFLGFVGGYWLGRSLNNSSGVVHKSGNSYTHDSIARNGDLSKMLPSKSASSNFTSGGFGNYGNTLHSLGS